MGVGTKVVFKDDSKTEVFTIIYDYKNGQVEVIKEGARFTSELADQSELTDLKTRSN